MILDGIEEEEEEIMEPGYMVKDGNISIDFTG